MIMDGEGDREGDREGDDKYITDGKGKVEESGNKDSKTTIQGLQHQP